MSLSKSENIFWKMIREQKKNASYKPELKEVKNKITYTKPVKKLNSTFLDRIEKSTTLNTPSQTTNTKKAFIKELEKIEKLSTFNKIKKLQLLCKEMISKKERFGKNRIQMIEKINKNCFNYYKNKISMKEIYDYCQSKKPEEHIDYILIEEPEKYFDDRYNDIYSFLFMLRNNNKMMLNLINNSTEEQFELLSDFIVNFCYEDTINSSFIQEELMLFIYLIFEKNLFMNLPEEIKIKDNYISYNILRNKNNILYYIIKSLTRKADIRNFLCSILVNNILKLEGKKKYLSPDIFAQKKFEDDNLQGNNNKNEAKPTLLFKNYTINEDRDSKLKLELNTYKAHKLGRTLTKGENIINEDLKMNNEKKEIEKENVIKNENKIENENKKEKEKENYKEKENKKVNNKEKEIEKENEKVKEINKEKDIEKEKEKENEKVKEINKDFEKEKENEKQKEKIIDKEKDIEKEIEKEKEKEKIKVKEIDKEKDIVKEIEKETEKENENEKENEKVKETDKEKNIEKEIENEKVKIIEKEKEIDKEKEKDIEKGIDKEKETKKENEKIKDIEKEIDKEKDIEKENKKEKENEKEKEKEIEKEIEIEIENKKEEKIQLENINNKDSDNNIGNNDQNDTIYNSFLTLDNNQNYNLNKIILNPFFEKNNATSEFISKKLHEYEHYSKTNAINLAMIDYLSSLLKDIDEYKSQNKYEIYSNWQLINVLKINKSKNEYDQKDNLMDYEEIIKNNYNSITEIILDIIEKLDENITSVPFTIKCISNIIEQLLNKKYYKKAKNTLSNYQKYIFKSNFFIGNILLSSIINRDYNGIITSDVTSKITTDNLKIIYDIFDKLLSGELFKNDSEEYFCYTLFNKLIIKTIPKIFNIIDKIEKKFKLPDTIQRLINTCTDINNNKRLNDFEYDYFFEKNEDIQYQSLCFSFETLGLLSNIMNKIKNKENYIKSISNEKDKSLLEKICCYENEFYRIYNNTKNNQQRCEYFYIYKLVFNNKIQNKINSILKDNLTDNNFSQNQNKFIIFKKCLIEVLSYVNIVDENSFLSFTQNKKVFIHNYENKKNIYKKIRKKEYNTIISENEIKQNKKEEKVNEDIDFKEVLFQKIMEYLKYEISFNFDNPKSQRIIFCTTYIQSHLEDISKEYSENNYCKLFMELIKETLTILNYLNSNILNQLYNKIKEGNKLNMIITSNYLQIKSMEKYKCIEYLYSTILIPNKFQITKDDKDIVTKIEYIRDKPVKKVVISEESNQNQNNDAIINNNNDKKESKEKDKEVLNNNNDKKELKEKKKKKLINNKSKEKEKKNIKNNKDKKESKENKNIKNNKDKKESKEKKNQSNKDKKESKEEEKKNLNNNEHNNNNEQNNNNIENNNNDNNIKNELNNTSLPPPPKLELIQNLIDIIPNYREYEKISDNILKIEEDTDISNALKNFFRTMKILVKKEKIIKRFSKEDVDSIVIELENYILFKLYDKLYPTKSSKDDIRFYKKCCRLNFIKPNNLITDKNIVNEKLWNTSMNYINEMNYKYTPAEKIKSISKSFAILQNSITFCSGKKELGVDDTIKPLIYILIKSKPTNIFNNYNYCQLFLNSDLAKKEYGILLTQIYMIMRIIKDMKYNELIGVSEQQFGKDED